MRTTLLWFLCGFVGVISLSPVADADVRKGRQYYEQRGDAVWDAPTGKKAIALTFDDGPDPAYTPQILDILKQHHVHATFFVVGSQVARHPSLIVREIQEGHEVENHTYTHQNLRRKSIQVIEQEIETTQQVIAPLTHRRATFFRPPGGYYNDEVMEAARHEGCKVVLWSWDQDSEDWRDLGTTRIVKRVVRNADDGDIVLLHDRGGNRKQTVEALNRILTLLQEQGFHFVTVSEMLRMGP